MFLKRKNIPIEFKKKENQVTLGIHALTKISNLKKKTDETKSNQTEPYPSIVTN